MGRIVKLGGRSIAGIDLTCETVMVIGKAIAHNLLEHKNKSKSKSKPGVFVGMDTRISSPVFMAALSAGLCSIGVDVIQLGVLPTPAVAYLVKLYEADLGIMITASHNPAEYNGIKIFDKDGYVYSNAFEETIENLILDTPEKIITKSSKFMGRISYAATALEDYINHLYNTISGDLSGVRFVVDCANGCASVTAPLLFSRLGADAIILNDQPNGLNINLNCGSTHMKFLADYVKTHGMLFGFAFDGDADRFLAVDENGCIIDGDKLLSIFAYNMSKKNTLLRNTVVTTYMSNIGFLKFAEKLGLKIVITNIGENYVVEEMRKHGYSLGGEQSGHIILGEYTTTGDSQLSTIQLLSIIKQNKESLSSLAKQMTVFPQVLLNVEVNESQKTLYNTDPNVLSEIARAEKILLNNGRVLVRASITEPLVRVMLEGEDLLQITKIGKEICIAIQRACFCEIK
jgi:phosphoglucosamine mutase